MKHINIPTSIILCFLCSFILQWNFAYSDLAADRAALIRFSSTVQGNTFRWNVTSPSPCNWTGVTCDNVTNRVTELRLPGDGLSGEIPLNSIGNLTELRRLSLRNNRLSGVIPSDLERCSQLQLLFLQNNQFSGEIPASFYRLSNITRLDISSNSFSGEINPSFSNLTSLTHLYLEENQFTGQIPDLSNNLLEFNVSRNRLNGSIPARFSRFPVNSFNNNNLCGPPLASCPNNESESSKLSGGAIAGIAIGSAFGSILIIAIIYFVLKKCNKSRNSRQAVQDVASTIPASPEKPPEYNFRSPDHIMASENTGSEDSGRVENNNDELTFFEEGGFLLDDLLRASAEVLGKGIVGTTYKAYLDQGGVVIVKRLKNVCVTKKDFTKRIMVLGDLYHQNLLPIKGYYFGKEEKLLVFDFMPIGSLSSILHGNMEEKSHQLTLEIRSKIAFEVASGLQHLHSKNLSHGDIKSNNILLTHGFQASLSEAGLIQLVSSSTPSLSGYRAPELIDTRVASKDADVYSFGILILELLTGKDPTTLLNEEGTDLPSWVQSVDESRWTNDVFDVNLVYSKDNVEMVTRLLHLGIRCASQVPRRRGSLMEVVKQIRKICKF